MDARIVIDLADEDGGTRVQQVTDCDFLPQLGPIGRLLDDLAFRRVLAGGQRENMRSFKRTLEAQPAGRN